MGVVNQYYVGNDDREALIRFETFYNGCSSYPRPGEATQQFYEIYYEGKYYDLLDALHKFAAKENVEFYVFCYGEEREDYYCAIVNGKGIYRKDVEIIYPSFRDCEEMVWEDI